ncbi:MAG: SulP family inorganic anion transporter [Spongiibacteraceae bacterium]|nr:SulP family inorganic anion transporter [Spongiibacteraceae bacterium]
MQLIHGLHFNNLRGDIFGGLTAAVVALPLALAFGVSSGAGPIAGLYGAIFVGFFAALFGGTPSQISGPTGPMTVVMAAIFTQYVAIDPIQGPALAFTVVMMGGLFQILFGVLRIGTYINYVPQPVISGFMSGIGVIIILLQAGPLLGHPAAGGPLESLQGLPGVLSSPVWSAAMLGLLTLIIVFFTPSTITRLVPAPLIALVVGTLLLLFVIPSQQVTILGDLPSGLPSPQLPLITAALLPEMIKSALILALLGTIDSLLTSLVADNITRTRHQSNRELIGQGIGNTVAGIFGGLPGAGATMRTMINVRAGGQTPISGVLHALVLLSIVLGLGSAASYIPHVVLAGILIKVGTDIIDWDYLKRAHRSSRAGVVMMFTVLFMTVFVDLIIAVGTGMMMACLLFLKRQSDLQLSNINVIRDADEEAPLSDQEKHIIKAADQHLLLFHLGGPMSFGAAKEMVHMLSYQKNYEVLVLDLCDVPALDYTASRAIEDMIIDTLAENRQVLVALPAGNAANMLQQEHCLDNLPPAHCHSNRLSALQHAKQLLLEAEKKNP